MSSLADLINTSSKTTGDVPPPLVGASVTVLGDKLYVFAGRLVSTRRMTNDIHVLDLATLRWTKWVLNPKEGSAPPQPRYFHSANAHGRFLIFFGGMSMVRGGVSNNDSLIVLDDVAIFDTVKMQWSTPTLSASEHAPKPRYAHLSAISANKLMIAGGQDIANNYLEDIAFLDLTELKWTRSFGLEKQCGAYRSVAISDPHISDSVYPDNVDLERKNIKANSASLDASIGMISPIAHAYALPRSEGKALGSSSSLTSAADRTRHASMTGTVMARPNLRKKLEISTQDTRRESELSCGPTNPIYLYSNYNFTDVRRELHIIKEPPGETLQMTEHSDAMTGVTLPPGLRFPNGSICGQYLLLSGTYLTNTSQTFSIWSLHLETYQWTRIEIGHLFASGSWNKGLLYSETNSYIVLGNRDRSLVEDYNHRQTNFDHINLINLEAFAIYKTNLPSMSPLAVELGLMHLNDSAYADMDILTQERTLIPVNYKMLSSRWPGFHEAVLKFSESSKQISGRPDSASTIGATRQSSLPTPYSATFKSQDSKSPSVRTNDTSHSTYISSQNRPRTLYIPYSHVVVGAFVTYLYTETVPSDVTQSATLLTSLLLLACTLDGAKIERLVDTCKDGLHKTLTVQTAALIYETAALTGQKGLQIRALKHMIQSKRAVQRSRGNSDVSQTSKTQTSAAAPGN